MSSYITKSFWVVGSKDARVVNLFLDWCPHHISVFYTFISRTVQRSQHPHSPSASMWSRPDHWCSCISHQLQMFTAHLKHQHFAYLLPFWIWHSAIKVSHATVFVDVFPKFPAFMKQVETYVFREFARLPSLCNSLAPQYAQTNLKQAQCIKAWSTWAAPVTPVVFHHWSEVFQGFYAKSSF